MRGAIFDATHDRILILLLLVGQAASELLLHFGNPVAGRRALCDRPHPHFSAENSSDEKRRLGLVF